MRRCSTANAHIKSISDDMQCTCIFGCTWPALVEGLQVSGALNARSVSYVNGTNTGC